MQVNHLGIWAFDIEKLKDFYVKYFHCKVSEKYENKSKQFTSYFLSFSSGCRIELMKRSDITEVAKVNSLGLAHIAITVGSRDKVDELTKVFESNGLRILSYPRLTGDGYYESVIADPENNTIELVATQDYQISLAKQADLEEILYIQKCCYLSEAAIYNDYTIPPLKQNLSDIEADFRNQSILKLVSNNKIVGSVRGYVKDDTCYVGKLIVDKEYQNMGFGAKLIREIETMFAGVNRFELFTGSKSDKNLYLYQKLGYREFKSEDLNDFTLTYLEKNVGSNG